MSVEFEEPQFHYRTIDISKAVTHNTPYLIRWGIIKDLRSANITMLVLLSACIIASITIIFYRSEIRNTPTREDYSPAELRRMLPETLNSLPNKNQ